MNSYCDDLDDFLIGDLDDDKAERFARHLDECATCREAVDQQRWLDAMLQSSARDELEPVPGEIVDSVCVSWKRRRRRQRVVAGALATAAALAVAAGWTVWAGLRTQNPQAEQVAQSDSATMNTQNTGGSADHGFAAVPARPQPPGVQSRSPERIGDAVVVGSKNTIVVPVESQYPNVTVVQVYRTYRPVHLDTPGVDKSYPGSDFSIPDYLNGG